MGPDQKDGRHIEKELDCKLRGGIERVFRAAMRSWATTLRLCLVLSVVAATLTTVDWIERLAQAAMRSWATTLRLCLVSGVVAATLTIEAYMIYPLVLPLLMG
jgi:hypothetical protein